MEDRERATKTLKEHREIYNAIVAKNAELAMQLSEKHIEYAREHMLGRVK